MERQKSIIIGSIIIGLIIVVLILCLTIRNKDGFFLFVEKQTDDLKDITDLDVLNIVYPVDTVYLTTDANFLDPTKYFGGGFWVKSGPINGIWRWKRQS